MRDAPWIVIIATITGAASCGLAVYFIGRHLGLSVDDAGTLGMLLGNGIGALSLAFILAGRQ